MAERLGVALGQGVDELERPDGGPLVGALAGQGGEPQKPEGGARGAGGDRRVVDVLAPGDELLVVGGGREEPAPVGVGEALEDDVAEAPGLGEVPLVEAGLVEGEEGLEQERVVLEVGAELGLAVVERAARAGAAGVGVNSDWMRQPPATFTSSIVPSSGGWLAAALWTSASAVGPFTLTLFTVRVGAWTGPRARARAALQRSWIERSWSSGRGPR
jgi:hypothetical protein